LPGTEPILKVRDMLAADLGEARPSLVIRSVVRLARDHDVVAGVGDHPRVGRVGLLIQSEIRLRHLGLPVAVVLVGVVPVDVARPSRR
jgi:hypothetical protein